MTPGPGGAGGGGGATGCVREGRESGKLCGALCFHCTILALSKRPSALREG